MMLELAGARASPTHTVARRRVDPIAPAEARDGQNRQPELSAIESTCAHRRVMARRRAMSPTVCAIATPRASGASECRVLLNRQIGCRGGETWDVHRGGLIRNRRARLDDED